MDKRTFMKKFAIWTAVVVAVVMLIIGLCFGKVIEETLFGEIMKWVVMTAVIIGIFEVFAYTLGQLAYDIFVRPKNGDYE
jgi:undecaprenyl pyrophosphate phosphatase UppP